MFNEGLVSKLPAVYLLRVTVITTSLSMLLLLLLILEGKCFHLFHL